MNALVESWTGTMVERSRQFWSTAWSGAATVITVGRTTLGYGELGALAL
jgi:hypothetical protein